MWSAIIATVPWSAAGSSSPCYPAGCGYATRCCCARSPLCRAVERELTSVLGIDAIQDESAHRHGTLALRPAATDPGTGDRDPRRGSPAREPPAKPDQPDLHLPLCTASLPLAAAAQFAAPALLPAAAVLFAYTSIPTFKEARRFSRGEAARRRCARRDRRGRLPGTMSIFPGAVSAGA